jgi:hypothetical protein
MSSVRERKLIQSLPVAKFWYNGTKHRHPVRRTMLITNETDSTLIGYELRCGNTIRTYREAVAGGRVYYDKSKVTLYGQYCRLRDTKRYKSPSQTTMRRLKLLDLVKEGV